MFLRLCHRLSQNNSNGSGDIPEGSGNIPEGSGNIPEGSGDIPYMIARLRERQKEAKRIIALTEKAIGDLTTCFSGGKADYIIRTYAERSRFEDFYNETLSLFIASENSACCLFEDFYNETLSISAKIKELQKKWEKELRG